MALLQLELSADRPCGRVLERRDRNVRSHPTKRISDRRVDQSAPRNWLALFFPGFHVVETPMHDRKRVRRNVCAGGKLTQLGEARQQHHRGACEAVKQTLEGVSPRRRITPLCKLPT